MTDAAEQAEWDSDNGSYLAGLKGVTIPGTAPSLNESHKRGRHGSTEDALRANASDMIGIFESLNGKPAVQMTVESIVPAKTAPKAEGDDAENADNANQTARGNEDEHRKANGATAARARNLGLDPYAALRRHDAYPLLDAANALLRTGPTRTNVNDLLFVFVE